jgi:PDGLE domain
MSRRASIRLFTALALSLAVGLAFLLSPYASASPDGLNRVAGDKGFDDTAEIRAIQDRSPVPGYAFPSIGDERLAKGVAGFIGTLGVFAVGYGVAYVVRRRDPAPRAAAPSA